MLARLDGPALGIRFQCVLAVLQRRYVEHMAMRIPHATHPEGNAVDHQGPVPPSNLTFSNAFEQCPDGHPADLGGGLQANTWRHVCLVQELEPFFTDELAVSQETGNPLGWQDMQDAFHQRIAYS